MNPWIRLATAAAICAFATSCTQIYLASDPVRTLNNAKKETVVIVFETVNGNVCPIRVMALGSGCDPGLVGPDTVCRDVGNGNSGRLKKVKWVKDAEAPGNARYSITFPRNDNPCTEATVTDTCNIKSNDVFKLDPGQSVIVKYDVAADGCDPLDPYIIVMR